MPYSEIATIYLIGAPIMALLLGLLGADYNARILMSIFFWPLTVVWLLGATIHGALS